MNDAARAHDATSLAERLQPVAPILQVVQRAEQQHHVDRIVVEIERTRIADRAVDPVPVAIPDLFDVMRDEITMDHFVTRVDEPIGVAPRTASDVRDHGTPRRKRSLDDLYRPAELDAPDPERKSVAFFVPCVVRLQLAFGHAPSCRAEHSRAQVFRAHAKVACTSERGAPSTTSVPSSTG